MMSLSIAHIVINTDDSHKASRADRFKDGLASSYYFGLFIPVYALAGLGFIGGLAGFHCYLVGRGISTNEFIKKLFKNRKNPHSHGFFSNYIYAFYPTSFPSFAHKKAKPQPVVPASMSSVEAI